MFNIKGMTSNLKSIRNLPVKHMSLNLVKKTLHLRLGIFYL